MLFAALAPPQIRSHAAPKDIAACIAMGVDAREEFQRAVTQLALLVATDTGNHCCNVF